MVPTVQYMKDKSYFNSLTNHLKKDYNIYLSDFDEFMESIVESMHIAANKGKMVCIEYFKGTDKTNRGYVSARFGERAEIMRSVFKRFGYNVTIEIKYTSDSKFIVMW